MKVEKSQALTPEEIQEQKNPWIHKMYPKNVDVAIKTKDDSGGMLTDAQRFDLQFKKERIRDFIYWWHGQKAPHDKTLFRIADEFIINENHPTVRAMYLLSVDEFEQLHTDIQWWGINVYYGNLYPDFCDFIKTRSKPTNGLIAVQHVWKKVIDPVKYHNLTIPQFEQVQRMRDAEYTAWQLTEAAISQRKLRDNLAKPRLKTE